jgi:hypothetical protein
MSDGTRMSISAATHAEPKIIDGRRRPTAPKGVKRKRLLRDDLQIVGVVDDVFCKIEKKIKKKNGLGRFKIDIVRQIHLVLGAKQDCLWGDLKKWIWDDIQGNPLKRQAITKFPDGEFKKARQRAIEEACHNFRDLVDWGWVIVK